MTHPSNVLLPLWSSVEVDRLSFEYDKQRKQRRADAKARTLLAHINRVDEYSRRQQQLAESHDNLRLAVKAMHRQEHFERAFDEVWIAFCCVKGYYHYFNVADVWILVRVLTEHRRTACCASCKGKGRVDCAPSTRTCSAT